MKKGVFIVYDDINNNTGVNRKIQSQIDAFRECGIKINPVVVDFKVNIPGYKILYRLPFSNVSPVWKYSSVYDDLNFIYMRRPMFCNFWFLKFLREIKQHNPRIKIIYEIPTYPYDAEISQGLKKIPVYLKDKLARRFLYKYIDRIAILSGEKCLWGINTLSISNGYNFKNQSVKQLMIEKQSIDIVAVALFDAWHGYERLIKGLAEYYGNGGNRKIYIHFVGDGPAVNNYKKLADEYQMTAHCIFYGMKNQAELDEVYNHCDLAVASLGLYRIKINISKELKSREYLSKGLPIICSSTLDLLDFKELKSYLLEFPNDDTSIDLTKIVEFYDGLYANKTKEDINEMILEIRNIAEEKLNMINAMKPVIDYILE